MRDAMEEDRLAAERATAIANGTYREDALYTQDFSYSGAFNYDPSIETRPVFAISIYCEDEQRFGSSALDTIYIHLDEEAAQNK
jgi:hypothetical protein